MKQPLVSVALVLVVCAGALLFDPTEGGGEGSVTSSHVAEQRPLDEGLPLLGTMPFPGESPAALASTSSPAPMSCWKARKECDTYTVIIERCRVCDYQADLRMGSDELPGTNLLDR